MELGLSGKVIVVTGASKGIGLAIAEAFLAEGANVVTASRSVPDHLASLGGRDDVHVCQLDLADTEAPAAVVKQATEVFGGVDVLVNNVGMSFPRSGFLDLEDDEWQRMWNLNFMAAVRATRAAIPALLTKSGSSIVNITSLNSRSPHPLVVDYSATKAALLNLTKSLSEEFAPQGLRVNAISPGFIRTPMWTEPGGFGEYVADLVGADLDKVIAEVGPEMLNITLGRFSEPEEVAALAVFLASDAASSMTGAEYLVDGGVVKTL